MAQAPTGPFTILEPRHQDIGKSYVVQQRRKMDVEGLKLRKGRSWKKTLKPKETTF